MRVCLGTLLQCFGNTAAMSSFFRSCFSAPPGGKSLAGSAGISWACRPGGKRLNMMNVNTKLKLFFEHGYHHHHHHYLSSFRICQAEGFKAQANLERFEIEGSCAVEFFWFIMSLGLAKASQCKAQVSKQKRIGVPKKIRVVADCAGYDTAVHLACVFSCFCRAVSSSINMTGLGFEVPQGAV